MYFCTLRQPQCNFLRVAVLLYCLLPVTLFAADYRGQNVDGPRYSAFARSLETGKYYPASIVFDHSRANVRLESGKSLDLTLDEQSVEDPEEVLATDPHGRWWALSVDGLDEPKDGLETSAVVAQARTR